ncbi:MAG: DUF2752 domain-containing protein [Verrucomicrobiales bacterium]|nr:DUF2752 domain-containing protein [Verrucomicrobiales bacterium]
MPAAAKWSLTFAVLLVGLVLASYLLRADLGAGNHFLPKCVLKSLTGLNCPGCGNTRAAQALLRGDVAGAVQQNVLFIVSLPFLFYWGAKTWVNWVFPGTWKPIPFFQNLRWKQRYSVALIILLIAFSVLRNVPIPPFTWLAPVPVESRIQTTDRLSPDRASRLPNGGPSKAQ